MGDAAVQGLRPVWEVPTRRAPSRIRLSRGGDVVAVSSGTVFDQEFLLIGGDGRPRWNRRARFGFNFFEFSDDDLFVLLDEGDFQGRISVVGLSGQPALTYERPAGRPGTQVNAAGVGPDGTSAVAAFQDGYDTALVWVSARGPPVVGRLHGTEMWFGSASRGTTAAIITGDGTGSRSGVSWRNAVLRVFVRPLEMALERPVPADVAALRVSPDGNRIALVRDHYARPVIDVMAPNGDLLWTRQCEQPTAPLGFDEAGALWAIEPARGKKQPETRFLLFGEGGEERARVATAAQMWRFAPARGFSHFVVGYKHGGVELYDAQGGLLASTQFKKAPTELAVSDGGALVVAGRADRCAVGLAWGRAAAGSQGSLP